MTNNVMNDLETLDFRNLEAILNWIEKFRLFLNVISKRKNIDQENSQKYLIIKKVIQKFNENGFLYDRKTYDDFKEDDKENVARYIIGQALYTMKNYHLIFDKVFYEIEDWKKKFI